MSALIAVILWRVIWVSENELDRLNNTLKDINFNIVALNTTLQIINNNIYNLSVILEREL